MGRNKRWNGYTSWSYLEANVDYDFYPLEKQIDRVPKYDFGLSKTQEERVEELIENNLILSLHEHLNVFPEGFPVKQSNISQRRLFKSYEGLYYSGLDVVIDNSFGSTFDDITMFLGMSLCDYAHQDFIIPAFNVNDINRAFKEGKVAIIHAIEHASAIDNDIDKIDILYGLGIRSMGIVFSESNRLGSGCKEIGDGGLTDLGYDSVQRMNKTGIIIDVSHAGDRTAMETIEASKEPILISHCGSRTLTNTARMLPDNVLQFCAEKGGVIGVEVAGFAPTTKKHPDPSIECLLEHIEYLIDLLGADHVGAGPDTMYADHAGIYRNAPIGESRSLGAKGHYVRPRHPELPKTYKPGEMVRNLDYVKGLESPSDFTNIIRGLVRDGYSNNEISKIIGLNGLRIIKICWCR